MKGDGAIVFRRYVIISVVIIFFLSLVEVIRAEEQINMDREHIVGGPCEYKSYSGTASIVSIKEDDSSHGAVEKKYEIRFTFQPDGVISESFAETEGKKYTMLDKFSNPDQEFIRRHNINEGGKLPCVMKVIVRGTCTPVLFEFPFFEQSTKDGL